MSLARLLRIALKSILKNKMRSFLTSLGIIIGVSSVIIMVAVGSGSQQRIQSSINAMGTNLIMVMNGRSSMGGVSRGAGSRNTLKMEDADAINKLSHIAAASPMVRSGGQVIGGSGNWSTSVEGVNTSYIDIRSWEIGQGQMFTDKDVKYRRKVCLLGQTVVNELFPASDPIGQKIRIRNTPFTVIGVLKAKGQSGMGQDQDDIILAPVTTVQVRLAGSQDINMIFVSAKTMDEVDAAQTQITSLLRTRHKLQYEDDDDFRIRTQSEITEMATSTSKTLTMLLAAVASVSLIVGGIGIMNIMLVSVTERTKEIGIRMAIGARKKDILNQFLIESVTLSFGGGIIGISLAYGAVVILQQFTSLTAIINPAPVLLSVLFAAGVGVFFGIYPARKAANLDPIEALHYE